MLRMHQECRQLQTQCRSMDAQLRRAMKSRNQLGAFECYVCNAACNRKDRAVAHVREENIYEKKACFLWCMWKIVLHFVFFESPHDETPLRQFLTFKLDEMENEVHHTKQTTGTFFHLKRNEK